MVENAARTHEYSSLLSTRRSYSRSILSIWVLQRTTRIILFHSRVRRPGIYFKVKHSDFLKFVAHCPPKSTADFRRVRYISSPSSVDRDTLENFLNISSTKNQRTASPQSLHILFYIFISSTKMKREYRSEYSKCCLRVDIEEKYSRVRMGVLSSSTYFMKLVEYSRE